MTAPTYSAENERLKRRSISATVEGGRAGFFVIPYAPRQLSDLNADFSENTGPARRLNILRGRCPKATSCHPPMRVRRQGAI
jgi:hypothetical protein